MRPTHTELIPVELSAPAVPEGGWRNRLIRGDNLAAMEALLPDFADQVDLIYLDPPFATGAVFHAGVGVGEQEASRAENRRAEEAYSDVWQEGLGSYLAMMRPRLAAMRELLGDTGSLYLHCDWRAGAHLRLLLDEVFGPAAFLNEIVWIYGLGGSSRRYWPRKHDTILWYTKRPGQQLFRPEMIPASSHRMRGQTKKCPDWWDLPAINNMARERTGYPTQKPERLLERIIRSSSPEGGLVADFFCGSGTTGAVAQRLGRRWIMGDSSPWAVHITRKRLLEAPPTEQPFELLEVGRPDRRAKTVRGRVMVELRRDTRNPRRLSVELVGYEPVETVAEARQWSDYVDYWAVDWDWQGGVFRNCWHSFRTRQRRALATHTPWHICPSAASGRIKVKLVDIRGHEAEAVLEVETP